MKDYCSFFPDTIFGIYIGSCCKKHDNECGERGSYNPLISIKPFYDCVREKGLDIVWSSAITVGGTFFYLLEYPYLAYKKYKYREKNGKV